ncbi:MAG: hypothetical protein ACE5MI_00605 [Acidimicrobiia bacterium]
MDLMRFLHLVAAAVWLGGLITLAVLIPTLRRAGVTREQIQAMARRFGTVAWVAMATLIVTGIVQLWRIRGALSDSGFFGKLLLKLTLVGIAAGFTYWHQTTAREMPARTRATLEVAILVVSLAIFAVAVAL